MISVGDQLPPATLLQKLDGKPAEVDLVQLIADKNVIIFGVPGAFTPTCSAAHVPSFLRTKPEFDSAGVDEIICISVNDIHVMQLWAEETGAEQAGIHMLADGDGSFSAALGLSFSNPAVGMHGRSKRFAMYVEERIVKVLHVEEAPGVCELSGGEAMLEAVANL